MQYFAYMFFKNEQLEHAIVNSVSSFRPQPGLLMVWVDRTTHKHYPLIALSSRDLEHVFRDTVWKPGLPEAQPKQPQLRPLAPAGLALTYWSSRFDCPKDYAKYKRAIQSFTSPRTRNEAYHGFDIIPGASPRYWDSAQLGYAEKITVLLTQEPNRRVMSKVTRDPVPLTEPLRKL